MYKVMHIVATGKLSGAEKVVSDICTNLNKEKFKAVTVCAGDELKEYYLHKGIESYVIDISRLDPRQIRKLSKLIRSEKIDIVHGHDIKASIAGYLAAKGTNAKVISHMHASYNWMSKPSPLKFIDRHFRKKYNLSIACSEMAKDYYIEHNSSADANKIITLNNAFNFNELSKVDIKNDKEVKKNLSISEEKFIFGFLGRLLEIKGVDLLLDSFYEVSRENDNVMLLVVGDGPERSNLEKRVKDYNLEDKVIFTGYKANVYDYMNIFDCFILPSVTEGLPIAVLEAMALKKAVISTPVAGLKDLIKEGYNGILLKERNAKNLYKAMEHVYNNSEFRISIGMNAFDYLHENYNISNYIGKLEDIYLMLMEG